jgi:hypothetical protein
VPGKLGGSRTLPRSSPWSTSQDTSVQDRTHRKGPRGPLTFRERNFGTDRAAPLSSEHPGAPIFVFRGTLRKLEARHLDGEEGILSTVGHFELRACG